MRNSDRKRKKLGKGSSVFRRLKKNRLAMLGLCFIIFMALLAIFAPLIAPYGYETQDLYNIFSKPSAEHWFGTDSLGRDIFSRILYGGRYSLRIGIEAVALACSVGVVIGAVAGFYGGTLDMVLMRFLDILQSIPGLLMSIAVAATLGSGFGNCIIALSISTIPGYARMMRATIMNLREMEYVDAARSANASDLRIISKYMLPNALAPTIVQATMGVAQAILVAAMLSFIGLGVQPPDPEWGAMLSEGRNYLRDYPHLVMFPGLAIMLSVLSLNMLGDGLRDALDPRLKN